jgi:drug/metabolite transporter (DMT)-like permease
VLAFIPPGARYMLVSAFAFALMGVCVKLAGARGIPVLEIIAARALISLVLSYGDVKRKRISPFGEHRFLLFCRGLVGFIALTGVYYALVHLPFAEASVLQYLHPMFTALLALLLLRERPTAATLVCIAISFLGLIIMVRPGFLFGNMAGSYDALAVIIGIAGAFGSGLAYTLVRKLSALEDPSVIVFYFPLVCLPLTLILLGDDVVMPRGWTWLILVLVGVFTQIGQITLTRAMKLETASRAGSFSYSQVVFAALLGIWIFDEIPGVWTVMGASLIIIGALINLLWRAPKPTS